jgi:uncharacterized protein
MNDIKKYKFIKTLSELAFVDKIYLYGSRARNDANSTADIDLAIVCPSANIKQWHIILDIIENADTLLEIDCIRYEQITNQQLKSNIDKDKKVIYDKLK